MHSAFGFDESNWPLCAINAEQYWTFIRYSHNKISCSILKPTGSFEFSCEHNGDTGRKGEDVVGNKENDHANKLASGTVEWTFAGNLKWLCMVNDMCVKIYYNYESKIKKVLNLSSRFFFKTFLMQIITLKDNTLDIVLSLLC